ncbi:MAG: DUF11 domain-containing protein, partial [Gemmatimonadales bacterium]
MTPSTMLRRSTALFACVSALALPASGVAQTFTITRTSSPVLYLDLSSSLQGMYVSYQITNTGAPAGDVWTEITAFSGGVITLAANEDGLVHLGAIGTGESKAAFFYLQASGGTTVNQSHTVNVYTTKPPGTPLASQGFNLTSEQTIKANANKVLTTVVGPNPPTLGGIVTITVTGETGTIGAAKILTFTPATYVDWRADAYELLSTEITLSGANSGIFVDELLIPPDSITSTANTAYTAVYTFRAVGTTSAPTAVSPVGYISSGTQVKHTNTNDFGALEPVQPADNKLEVTKSANPTWFASGGTVTYTLTLRNTSTTDSASVDDFTDYLPTSPATVTYVPSSSTWKGSSIPDPVGTTTLSWYGTFTVQPSDSAKLVFQAAVPATEGAYTNSAVGHVSGEQIDTTLDTSDDSKATADVVVGGADIEVTKTGPASVTALDTITYLITTTNNGDQDADQVVVTDSLPSGMTFVSASRSASESGGEVTWPAIATLSNGSSVTDTVIVVAPASGPLENVAKVSSTTADPDATNNRSTVSTSVTEQADLEVVKTGPASVLANDTVTYVITTANNGPSTATNVTVTDTLPSGVTFVSATNGGAYTEPDSVVTWTIASLANGASQVDTVKVLAPASGTLDNLAAATSDTGDPDATNDTSSVSTSVTEQADLEVVKTGPASVLANDT